MSAPGWRGAARELIAALLLVLVGLAPLSGCPNRRRSLPTDVFVIHVDVEPPHLNPLLQEDVWLARITINNVFEGLVRRDPRSYRFLPSLATQWQFSADGRVLTFKMRAGVTFHDGKPFLPRDVIFTFDRIMDPRVTAGAVRSDFAELERWEESSAGEVVLTFKRPSFKILESLSHLSILPRHVYGTSDLNRHPANHRPVGTGPFRFHEWRRGAHIRLRRHDGYWGPRPALREVVYRLVRSKEKALELLKRQEIDLMPRVLPEQACGPKAAIEDRRLREAYRVIVQYPVQFYTVIFNVRRPLFADVRVRQALAMLVNRELIAEKIYCRRARVISGPYWIEKPGYDRSVKPWPYDPQRAASRLREAGFRDADGDGILEREGQRLQFTYLQVAESSVQRRLLPILREELRKAGIRMDVETISWTQLLARLKGHQFDVTDLNWFYYYDQDLFQIYHSSQCDGGSNYGCYANSEVDDLLARIRTTLEDDARNVLERRLHGILHRDLPGLYLLNVGDVTLVGKRWQHVYPSAEWFQLREIRAAGGGQ